MIWVAKNLYFFNCLLDGAHTRLYCYALCNGGFEKIRAAVSFRLSKMNDDPTPCNLVRRHIGGCRRVNFCHSQ